MKMNKLFTVLAAGALVASCSDIECQDPEGGTLTKDQLQATNIANPARVEATFSGMYSMMVEPLTLYGKYFDSARADDFGYGMMAISQDLEGADMSGQNNNYNWFSTASELSTRNANYANPFERYTVPYMQIGIANEVLAAYPADTEDQQALYNMAQARAIRAYDYMALAPYFGPNYENNPDALCVPIIQDGVDYAQNPRATVKEVWDYILADLDWAIEHLEGYNRPDKNKIDLNVAYGLRARANLAMARWTEAAADAEKAMEGYTPASIEEVSTPSFYDVNDHNWMWGYIMSEAMSNEYPYGTVASWLSAFTWNGYGPATQNVPVINVMLYNKIPDTDVRKGWWLDADLHSPLLEGLQWANEKVYGQDIATWEDENGDKVAFLPYTNVKFGMKSGVGSNTNNNDWPFMRVEEMYLIQAEGLAKSGHEGEAVAKLESFVKTYRDPAYSVAAGGRTLADEIWYQRRVELWGEGFFTADMKRLGKPMVRFHEGIECNLPEAFQFNMEATDGWLNMRFPQREMDNNNAIVDNTGGDQPVAGQNGHLRDGVTD